MANQLDVATAQFLGFNHARKGYSIKELATGMGLKKSEWLKIREDLYFTDLEKEEIDSLFKPNQLETNRS